MDQICSMCYCLMLYTNQFSRKCVLEALLDLLVMQTESLSLGLFHFNTTVRLLYIGSPVNFAAKILCCFRLFCRTTLFSERPMPQKQVMKAGCPTRIPNICAVNLNLFTRLNRKMAITLKELILKVKKEKMRRICKSKLCL